MTITMTRPLARPAPRPPRPSRLPGPPSRRRLLSSALELGAYPEAVASARLHTRAILDEWGLGELAGDACQIVSELVTNAVETHQREHLDAPVRLTLLAGLRTVLIVVRDSSSRPPVPDNPDFDLEHGRGLLIVDALAARWDAKPHPDGGKIVRAFLMGERRGVLAGPGRGQK